jgi:asparagine synthase (glutamine-hydrolysing)
VCGIAGVYGEGAGATTEAALDAQMHRGPDDRGSWRDASGRIWLGHVRLSIIDVSSAGHQPMSYLDGRLWIAFNGEIYNFAVLRAELENLGHRFCSHSDTEVVLAAYAEWGPSAVERLDGMFAFAIYDRAPPPGGPEVLLARDRFGIKPLLLHEDRGTVRFASELRALVADGAVERTIDPDAILDYLAVGSVFQPRTIAKNVSALPPAHYLVLRRGERRLVRYWDLHDSTESRRRELRDLNERDAVDLVRHALAEATRANMIADVPVGAFLSGGIDSTAIVGFMTRASGRPVKTFSVGFESAYGAIDERGYAREAASHLGTEHEEVVVTAAEASAIFPQIVAALDQPSIDGTNTWIVSRAARRSVTVALSGLGGDELFAGYPHFEWLANARGSGSPGARKVWESLRKLRIPVRGASSFVFRRQLASCSPSARLALLRRLLGDHELSGAVRAVWAADFRDRLAKRHDAWLKQDADEVQQTSYGELNGYLVSTLLRDSDVMAMAHGLEVRPVLLDHRLAELAYSLPARLKSGQFAGKKVLVRAAAEFLPVGLRERPKMGFALPFTGWMSLELRPVFLELLSSDIARDIFEPSYLREVIRSLRVGRPPTALWGWGILLAWLRQSRFSL